MSRLTALGFFLFFSRFVFTHGTELGVGELLLTRITLNYRIIQRYHKDELRSTTFEDVHTGEKIENPEVISTDHITEERYEDTENLLVIKYDLKGGLKSRKAFKKSGNQKGEILLNDQEVEAIEKYDVNDESLLIQKIDWDKVVFSDENISKETITRWSWMRNYMVKTDYTRDGLIHRRMAWNRFTGARVPADHRIYVQSLKEDVIQNHRGFIETHYNVLGKVTAIRSWDRKSGKLLDPPKVLPFSSRLERDHLRLNFEDHQEFRRGYFLDEVDGKPLDFKEGQSLFRKEKKKYQLLDSVSFSQFANTRVSGKIGKNRSGRFGRREPHTIKVGALWHPGKIPIVTEFQGMTLSTRIDGAFQVKNTLYGFGSDMEGEVLTLDTYMRRSLFSRQDGQLDLLGGIRANHHDLRLEDGSRISSLMETTLQPIVGTELIWYPRQKSSLRFHALGTRFHVGGVDTAGLRSGVEYRQQLPISMSDLLEGMEIAVGYRRNDYQLKTDTDTLSEVGFETFWRGAYLEVKTSF